MGSTPIVSNLKELIKKYDRESRLFKILSLIIFPDFIATFLAASTAYFYRFEGFGEAKGNSDFVSYDYELVLPLVALLWFLTLVASGSYALSHNTLMIFNFSPILKRTVGFFFFLSFVSFILRASFSRWVFLIMLTSGVFYLFFIRLSVYLFWIRPLKIKRTITSNLIVIGRNVSEIESHVDWLIKNRTLGFTVARKLICPAIDFKWVEEFDLAVSRSAISEVLLLPGMESDPSFSKLIHYCEDLGIHVNWIPLDSGNLGYWLSPSPQEGIPFLSFKTSNISIAARALKRAFDLFFAIAALIFLSPIFLAISVGILISSGRPITYTQERIGLNGKPFKFFKFRSMIKDADKKLHEVANVHGGDHVLFKNRQDPRITPLGRVLRKYSLDELPQFLNVVNGTMSVVGPRPALPSEAQAYNSLYERRLIAKPGITGPWQISGRSDLDLRTSVALDLNYLKDWSFSRDLWIIAATVGAVIKGRGAY